MLQRLNSRIKLTLTMVYANVEVYIKDKRRETITSGLLRLEKASWHRLDACKQHLQRGPLVQKKV